MRCSRFSRGWLAISRWDEQELTTDWLFFPIPCSMQNGKDQNLFRLFVDPINDDVGSFDELACSLDEPGRPMWARPPIASRLMRARTRRTISTAAFGLSLEIQSNIPSRSAAAASWITTFIRRAGRAAAR